MVLHTRGPRRPSIPRRPRARRSRRARRRPPRFRPHEAESHRSAVRCSSSNSRDDAVHLPRRPDAGGDGHLRTRVVRRQTGTHEIGIRMALGAPRSSVVSRIPRSRPPPGAIGAGLGIVAALGVGRLIGRAVASARPIRSRSRVRWRSSSAASLSRPSCPPGAPRSPIRSARSGINRAFLQRWTNRSRAHLTNAVARVRLSAVFELFSVVRRVSSAFSNFLGVTRSVCDAFSDSSSLFRTD